MRVKGRDSKTSAAHLHIGFVPLLDAAPIVVACEAGYFADEGLRAKLVRQIGWGNVRDKLTFGNLDASHALLGMPPLSHIGASSFPEPLVSLASLGFGGNAITFSHRWIDRNIDSVGTLSEAVAQRSGEMKLPRLAHVFGCSTHHYLLRSWLAAGKIDPDKHVHLCVLPPAQMVGQIAQGYIDGFCVGEPWNTAAVQQGSGSIVALTTQIVPTHPEKVLAVTRKWNSENPRPAMLLVRAILRACEFCADPANRPRVIEMLARPQYLDVSESTLAASYEITSTQKYGPFARRQPTTPFYGINAALAFPSAAHPAWLMGQMKRWGHLRRDLDIHAVAMQSTDTTAYRQAAEGLGLSCPADDFAPMNWTGGADLFAPRLTVETKTRPKTVVIA